MNTNNNDFQPCNVLKIYRQEFNDNYYIEIHGVIYNRATGESILGAGRPLQKKTFQRLLGTAGDDNYNSSFQNILLSPRLLACEPIKYKRHILWYDPAGSKEILFTKEIKLEDGIYSMPALLYFVSLDKIKVFAMKTGNKRPGLHSNLYFAPLFNQIESHEFCWGNVKKDVSAINEIDSEMNAWDAFLWNSRFSEYNTSVTKKSLTMIYKKVKNKVNKFPNEELIDTKLTIKTLLGKYLI